jgi:hypothetical protein
MIFKPEDFETRKCVVETCSSTFKVLKISKKETCSKYCEDSIKGWFWCGRRRVRKDRKSLDSIDSAI